jgi:hypothetical protein
MTWASWHKRSESAASEAHLAMRAGDIGVAKRLFEIAAVAEEEALAALEPAKLRTTGITAVSAAALWLKAENYDAAERVALKFLSPATVPPFAVEQLRSIVQTVWTHASMKQAGIWLLPGQVLVSVSGGQTVTGGAPLDLIVERVQTVQALFYRTIELMIGLPHRRRGNPSVDVQKACRPWLFQAAPGSYQFSVAIQQPKQPDFFRSGPKPPDVAAAFLRILKASSSDPERELLSLVEDKAYRSTFLNLARNLAPNGKTLTRVEVRSVDEPRAEGVVLGVEARQTITNALRAERAATPTAETVKLYGTLRGLELDNDWLNVTVLGKRTLVRGLPDAVDDLIGPFVNKQVVVYATVLPKGGFRFLDVEPTDDSEDTTTNA